ncbi:MAG: biotin--[acetyl-CoA-carboxylase] ligase [Gemmatimonadota bacterium]
MPDRTDVTPELWDAPALARKLGVEVIAHGAIGSTMQEARSAVSAPVVHLADEQRAGRGRHGRSWVSPPGNLYATIAWPDPGARIPPAVLAAIQAEITHAIRRAGGTSLHCKWPNDGFAGDGKWCGLLAEHDRGGGRLLIGVGANLERVPADPDLGAAALETFWTPWPGRVAAAETILGAALSLLQDGEAGVRRGLARWPDLDLWPIGAALRIETGDRILAGRYEGVAPDGRLVLETADGVVHLAAGEARRARRQEV